MIWKGIPVREMLAYPLTVVQQLLGVSRTTLWREIRLGRLKTTTLKRIPKFELERYLAEQLCSVS
jgi:predicted site-specific integrase-resolvase